jgi:hypothetical protein
MLRTTQRRTSRSLSSPLPPDRFVPKRRRRWSFPPARLATVK